MLQLTSTSEPQSSVTLRLPASLNRAFSPAHCPLHPLSGWAAEPSLLLVPHIHYFCCCLVLPPAVLFIHFPSGSQQSLGPEDTTLWVWLYPPRRHTGCEGKCLVTRVGKGIFTVTSPCYAAEHCSLVERGQEIRFIEPGILFC